MRHGSQIDPPNRFSAIHVERDFDQLDGDNEYLRTVDNRLIKYFPDEAKSLVVENSSPDIPFRYSVNPYRGCVHGCSYCYARNTHEYFGMNAGLDFETKVLVKHEAPRLLREFLSSDSWNCDTIVFSGVTDCYQPAEREFRLTRGCLEVASECNQPIGIVTKNALILRDIELLANMASRRLVHVFLSITSLDDELVRVMEPRTSISAARLRAIEQLTKAGIPVGAMAAPLIPGLNDHELPAIMKAAERAGAVDVRYTLLRLPLTVEPVFREWLARTQPTKAAKVESYLRHIRGGKLNVSKFGERLSGKGKYAEQIRDLYRLLRKQLGFRPMPTLDVSCFQPAMPQNGQRRLF